MKVLFLHPGFPGPFRLLAEIFGRAESNETLFVTFDTARRDLQIPGVKKIIITEKAPEEQASGHTPSDEGAGRDAASDSQPDRPTAADIIRKAPGLAAADLLANLKSKGWAPDLVISQPSGGMTLHIKDVFPGVPFLGFFDWYHNPDRLMETFSPDGNEPALKDRIALRNKNLPILADLVSADACICGSQWQKSQFPREFHAKLSVVHPGVDLGRFKADETAVFKTERLDLSGAGALITYTAGLLAPYNGFEPFLGALPKVLEKKPDTHVVIMGADQVSLADREGNKKSYKETLLEKTALPEDRVHFVERLDFEAYLSLLQASSLHVYLDSPLVLNRFLLEAMACECLVMAPAIPPVKEVIRDGSNGILFDFSSSEAIAKKILNCLDMPSFTKDLRKKARQTMEEGYSFEQSLNQQTGIIKALMDKGQGQERAREDNGADTSQFG